MGYGWSEYGDYGDYVSADEKRRRAGAVARKLEKKGRKLSPVLPAGRLIAQSFWGKAWCKNLESYSDYESRLPRGRSYLRQGAVLDLQISQGAVKATVTGTRLYEIGIRIDTLSASAWAQVKAECAGKVGSLMDLLQGKLAAPVMEVVTRAEGGLFPVPKAIHLNCSCPDWADLCKHVAAVLYGVGARLDQSPELLFTLRGVDHEELIASAAQSVTQDLSAPAANGGGNILDESSLSDIFGIEMEPVAVEAQGRAESPKPTAKAVRKKVKPKQAPPVPKPGPPARKRPTASSAKKTKKAATSTKVVRKKAL